VRKIKLGITNLYKYTLVVQLLSLSLTAVIYGWYFNSNEFLQISSNNPAAGLGEALLVIGGLLLAGLLSLIYFLVYTNILLKQKDSFRQWKLFEKVTYVLSFILSLALIFLLLVFSGLLPI